MNNSLLDTHGKVSLNGALRVAISALDTGGLDGSKQAILLGLKVLQLFPDPRQLGVELFLHFPVFLSLGFQIGQHVPDLIFRQRLSVLIFRLFLLITSRIKGRVGVAIVKIRRFTVLVALCGSGTSLSLLGIL